MHLDILVSGVSTLLSTMLTLSQSNEVFSWIQIAITILCGICTVISVVRNWYKDAKADGKITKDELKDLQQKLTDALSKVKTDVASKANEKKEEKDEIASQANKEDK